MQNEWKLINVAGICCVNDCLCINVTHVRNLALESGAQWLFTSTHDDVGLNTTRAKFGNTVLSGLCLLLAAWSNERHQCDMEITHVVTASFITELANCLEERQDFNVTDGSAHFRDHYICVFCGNTANTTFDFVGDVRDDLHCLSQIITATFGRKNGLIDGASCCVRATSEILINESFIVTKVEVCFTAIVSNKHFTMFKRIHCSRINVDVRIQLLHGDAKATHLQQTTE